MRTESLEMLFTQSIIYRDGNFEFKSLISYLLHKSSNDKLYVEHKHRKAKKEPSVTRREIITDTRNKFVYMGNEGNHKYDSTEIESIYEFTGRFRNPRIRP
jgi:hypothetical protein